MFLVKDDDFFCFFQYYKVINFGVYILIKCVSVFDKSNQMINEIFMAYTGSSNQRFTLEVGADLPIEVELVLSKPKQIAYIAWRFDYCIACIFQPL